MIITKTYILYNITCIYYTVESRGINRFSHFNKGKYNIIYLNTAVLFTCILYF